MNTTGNLFIVGMIIMIGLLAQYNFKKTKIPDVLILIGAGSIISYLELVEGLKTSNEGLTFIIIFSLIYVVFYGALPIKLRAIFSTMKYAFISSIMNLILITTIIGIISYYLLGFGWVLALSLGALFCVLDGSIINSILETIKLSTKAEAQIQTESAIIDILVIVGVLSIMNFSTMMFSEIMQNLTSYLFLSLGIGIVVAIIWAFVLKHVGNYSSAPIGTMAILVILYAFAEYVNANGVITVFFFSIMLGNVTIWSKLLYKEQKENVTLLNIETRHFFKDISFLIRTFLFVYLGILVDLSQWIYLLYGFVFFIIAYITRSIVRRKITNRDLDKKEIYMLDAMCAKGLTPTVMLAVIQTDIIFTNIVIGGIFSSVLVTSILIFLIDNDKFTSVNNLMTRAIVRYKEYISEKKNPKFKIEQ
ncbi:MAG: cation:proton antiporter [DPANN group archaeon]|nr:cation:proton antiporter [DPANN group archaeon]